MAEIKVNRLGEIEIRIKTLGESPEDLNNNKIKLNLDEQHGPSEDDNAPPEYLSLNESEKVEEKRKDIAEIIGAFMPPKASDSNEDANKPKEEDEKKSQPADALPKKNRKPNTSNFI
jgi:hypothetical protein